MNIKKIKVYHLFWIVAALILLIGLFSNNSSVLDLNIHDTYFVISNYHVSILLFICYFITGLGYWLVQTVYKKQLIKYLTIIHTVILIGSFTLYWVVVICGKLYLNDRTYNYFDDYALSNMTLVCEFILIAFVGLPVYIVNLLIAIFRKKVV